MRYFCFTYQYITHNGYTQGNYYIKSENFPSKSFLNKEIIDLSKTKETNVIFLNIFEFKNSEDYYNFINN